MARRLRYFCAGWVIPILVWLAFSGAVQAQYTYTTNNGTITITKYYGSGGVVTIPSAINGLPVTSIGEWAFGYQTNLTSVTMPDSVTSIGYAAFTSCTNLASITIGNGVTSIGSTAFSSCSRLTSVTIPESVTSMGGAAFWSCTGLVNMTIPNSVTNLGQQMFENCVSLTNVTLGNSVASIGNRTFYYCTSLNGVLIPDSITSIGIDAFYECASLSGVIIPNNVTSIGSGAFQNCTNLANAMLGNSLTSIGNNAFSRCTSLTNMTIPNAVTNLGVGVFSGCTNLSTVTLGEGVVSIGYGALIDCRSLTSITIPNSVTSLGNAAFFNCSSLTNVTIGNGLTNLSNQAFVLCGSLASVVIPNGVTRIGDDAFEGCVSLASVNIPNSVTSIGEGAFYRCTSLTSVTIPNSVTSIGESAFARCTGLSAITVDALNPAYQSVAGVLFNANQTTLIQCPAGKPGNYIVPTNVTRIGGSAFSECIRLSSIVLPDSVTSIGGAAFDGCGNLTGMDIPDSVTSIGDFAFADNTNLMSVKLSKGLSVIGRSMFQSCTSLGEITIPNGVTNIGGLAFYGCTGLTNVVIPDSVGSIGDYAFLNCNLSQITIPAGVTIVWDNTFYGCFKLRRVYFLGNAPGANGSLFFNTTNVTVFYLAGTTGWGTTFAGRPTMSWYPQTPGYRVMAWGDNKYGQTQVSAGLNNAIKIAAGSAHGVALRADGTLAAWGYNANGQCNVPAGLQDVTNVAAGMFHTVALKTNGTVIAWGDNGRGQTDVRADLPKVTTIAAGGFFTLALTGTGTVVGWGDNDSGQTTPPAGLSNVVAIAAGMDHGLALRENGTVVAWGANSFGQTSVPSGLTNVIAIAAGDGHSLAARQDGTVVAWGFNDAGQTSIPAGLSNVIAVAAGYEDSVALKQDGTVVGWGRNDYGQVTIPAGVQKAIAIAAGDLHVLALVPGVAGIAVTVQPDPPSCAFTVDGIEFSGAQSFSWLPGSSHVLGAPAQQIASPGVQCFWKAWSDVGAIIHAVAPATATNYAVSFASQYYLTMASGVGGQASPLSGWTNGGALVGIKATPEAGYRFDTWKGTGPGSYSGTNPAAVVTMNGPLTETATFVDYVKPTNIVTAPTPSQLWSNALFTARGQVNDNSGTAEVYYQVNGGGWTRAPLTMGAWQTDISLMPGTNLFRAYAVDADGNYSTTNNISLRYVADVLRVAMTGKGTLSPNYSKSALVFGHSYRITATSANGFGFVNWTIATNWLGGRIATNATIQFTMVPGLTLQAAFADVARPTCTVTAPTSGQRLSNAVFTVTGTARDNVQVTNVSYQLNGGTWEQATGTTNWQIEVEWTAGTNLFRAYSVDPSGLVSPTNSIRVFFVVPKPIDLSLSGEGSLLPDLRGQSLEVGRAYMITALPARDFLFSNWVGTVESPLPKLTFLMQSNMTLRANFVANPFLTTRGSYNGLVMDANNVTFTNAGLINLNVTDKGIFSGKLLLGGANLPLAGSFGVDGKATVKVNRTGKPALTNRLVLNLVSKEALGGTVSDGAFTNSIQADKAIFSTTNLSPYAGKYTLIIPGTNEVTGDGIGTVSLSSAGTITFSGALADGTVVNQSVPVSRTGWWPVYLPLYTGKGMFISWAQFDSDGTIDLFGDAVWTKQAKLGKYYTNGFALLTRIEGGEYEPPAPGSDNLVLSMTNGTVTLSGGTLSTPIVNGVVLASNNVLRITGTNGLKLTITPSSGLVSGSFIHPVTKLVTPIKAVVQQGRTNIDGFFLGTNVSGTVLVQP